MEKTVYHCSPSEITIGDRTRANVDEGIHELIQSIRELGQLQPIIVDQDLRLIAGGRRLRACELAEMDVEYVVCKDLDDAAKKLKAERDENTCRKAFSPSEAVEIGKRLEDLLKPAAEERMNAGAKQDNGPCDKLSQGHTQRVREQVAEAVGMSGMTYTKAKAVVKAAAKPDAPEAVKQAAAEMDRTGKVDPAFKAVMKATQASKPERSPSFVAKSASRETDSVEAALLHLESLVGKSFSLISIIELRAAVKRVRAAISVAK